MSNLIYGIFYADGYVDGGRDTIQCRFNCPHSPQSPTKKLKTKKNTE